MIDRSGDGGPRVDPLTPLLRLAVAHGTISQPQDLLQVLSDAVRQALGHILFTVLVFDRRAGQMRRIFSTRPEVNPVGGSKPITESDWMRQVLGDGRPYIGRTAADLREVFFDHEQLRAIGCESVLNMPVAWCGEVLGSLNMLDRAGHYGEDDLPVARLFAQLALPALLASRSPSTPAMD